MSTAQIVTYAQPPNPLALPDGKPRFDSRGLPIEMTQVAPAPQQHASPPELAITINHSTNAFPSPGTQANNLEMAMTGANGTTKPDPFAHTNGGTAPVFRNVQGSTRVSAIVRNSKRTPINLTWHDLTFEVPMPPAPSGRGCLPGPPPAPVDPNAPPPPKMKTILSRVTGYSRPGSMLAIMGSSGAGKTSLLNCLAGRESGFSGQVLMNGQKVDAATRKYTAFVQQADLFYKTLTVREHLLFQARLRLPSSTPEEERVQRVEDVISELGLDKTRNTLIGDVGLGGISGGERRRLSFANEVLLDPSLLFVDEPTSGLDSFMADNVVDILWQLSRAGRTIVCTIHQPSSDVFARFDSLCLLAEGRVAFFGTIVDAIAYFSRLNFVCPSYNNPADFFIKILSISTDPEQKENSKKQVKHILQSWADSKDSVGLIAGAAKMAEDDSKIVMTPSGHHIAAQATTEYAAGVYITSWWTQFSTLIQRSFTTSKRDPVTTKARLAQNVFISIIIGLIYLRLSSDQKAAQNKLGVVYFILLNQSMGGVFGVLQTFAAELLIFRREHKSQMYSPSAFFLSKTLSDLPFQIFFPIMFVCIAYWMVGLNSDASRFFTFVLIIVLTSNCAYSLGYIIATAAPTVQVALALGPVVLLPFMIFGGFLINLDSIPKYFYWLSYLSFFRYGFESLAITEFQGASLSCEYSGPDIRLCKYENGDQILRQYSFDTDNKWPDVGILIALLVGFRTVAFLFLWRKSQQKERAEGP